MLAYTWTFHEIFMKNAYECCIKNKKKIQVISRENRIKLGLTNVDLYKAFDLITLT